MGGAIESIQDMFERDIISNELSLDALNMACKAWNVHSDVAHNLIEGVTGLPTADFTASMSDGLDASDASKFESLNATWKTIASKGRYGLPRSNIRQHPVAGSRQCRREKRCLPLTCGFERKDGDHEQLLVALVTHPEIADLQRGRAWQQSERHDFGVQFLVRRQLFVPLSDN